MNVIYEEIFKLFDDTYIENLLKLILIQSNICKNDKKMIEILIENDKKNNFKRIKYLFLLELNANLGYFSDRTNDRIIFKLLSAVLTIFKRNILSDAYKENEKLTIINLEKTCFQKFNNNTVNVIFKNIEKNKNNDDYSFIQNVYLESYSNILIIFETYTLIIKNLFNFITELLLLTLTPFFFDQRHGVIRSTFNVFFAIIYVASEFFYIFKDFEQDVDDLDVNSDEFKVKSDIVNLFRNINIIIENNTIKEELSVTLNNIMKLLKNDDFRKRYELNITKKSTIKLLSKYKIIETFASIIINDAYLFNLTIASETAMLELGQSLAQLHKKLPMLREFINVLYADPYYTAETILWNNNDNEYENIFTLENVTVEYEENNIITTPLKNINLNFESNQSHFIYGNSGSGKTTLLNILMKRIKIKNGSIRFFGSKYTYFSIRPYLSYITSENALFSKSLYYNITYGLNKKIIIEKKNTIMTKIIEYMNLFGLERFISNIKTKNSIKLSKGQMQRVAILRLFIHIIFNDRRILFLDEFTSNIDNDMEKTIFTELKNLQKIYPFTLFYISHNLYNKKYSDYIYEINANAHSISKKITAEYE
jgi:ABC-type multidrug transport system fused ATPase/permease subunit